MESQKTLQSITETTTETTTETMPLHGESDFSDLFGEKYDESYIDIEVPDGDVTSPEAVAKPVNGRVLSEAEQANLLTFGVLPDAIEPDDKVYAIRQELKNSGWDIHSLDVEMAIAHFVQAVREHYPKFAIPLDASTRKDWHKSVGSHLQNYNLADLQSIYKQAIIKMRDAGLSHWRPGSLTKWALPEVVNSKGGNTVTNHTYTPNLSDEKRQRLAELIAENK